MTGLMLGYSHKRLRLDADAIDLILKHNVRHLEMRIDDIEKDSIMYSAAFRRELRSFCNGEGLSLSIHAFAGINLAEKIGRLRQHCVELHLEQMEFCEAVGARWLNLHLGTCGFSQDAERKASRLALAAESIDRLINETIGSPVGLGLENVERLPSGLKKAYLGDCLAELKAILDNGGDRIGAVFDIGHANLNPEREPADLLAELEHRLWGVHVHANAGATDEHAPLTLAWVDDHRRLFEALARLSRAGTPLIAEHHAANYAAATLEVLSGLQPGPAS